MNTAFLTTERYGTQWSATNLQAAYGELAVVEHEPLHDRYYPRLMLAEQRFRIDGQRCRNLGAL